MRTLCKKALALCVVFALALTCFVGTLSVSAADPYDATLTVADVDVNFGDTTATAVLHIAVAAPGINEAIINIDSTIGTIDAEPALDLETLVVDGGGDAYVDVVGDDFSKLFLSARRDPAVTELNGILTADITVVFTLKDGVKPGTYPINIVTEGVKAADKNETVVNLVYATAGNFIVACDHANATEDVTTAPTCTEPGVKTITCACGYTTTEPVDALGHAEELTYTSKEDGTHAVDCPNCEVAFDAEDCADEDANGACDKCGYVMTPDAPVCEHENATKTVREVTETKFIYDLDCPDCDEENLTLEVNVNNNEIAGNKVSRTIKPGNDIALWFMFRKEQQVGYTDLCLVVEKEVYEFGANEPNEENAVYYLTDPIDGRNSSGVLCDTFAFDKLAAYEMGNSVSVKLYGYSASKEMQLLKTTTYSISQFLTTKITAGGDPALMKVYVDILNYGAASQLLSDISMNTDDLVNATLTEAQKAYGTPVDDYCDTNTEFVDAAKSAVYNTESPVGYVTPVTTIAPESKVNIYFKYRVVSKDGTETYFTGDVNNLYCRYYYTDVMGVDQIVDCRYDGLMRDGLNAFKFDLQPIAQLDKPVKAVVYYGDPTEASSYQIMEKEYSIESFIKSQIGKANAGVKSVLQTMYAYGYSLKYCVENGLV